MSETVGVIDIANFVPSCVVCRNPVPPKRATGRSKDTCGPDCHKVLRQYRKFVLHKSKCPACYHPSTPEERRLFMQWRKQRGDRREKPGRPKKSERENQLVTGIMRAIEVLQQKILPGVTLVEGRDNLSVVIESATTELQKLIDVPESQ